MTLLFFGTFTVCFYSVHYCTYEIKQTLAFKLMSLQCLNQYQKHSLSRVFISCDLSYDLSCDLSCAAGNWDKLPAKEKQEKEMFLSGEQRASKGFMTQANTQMELLYNMSEAGPVAKSLCDPTLAKRTTAAVSERKLEILI